MKTKLRVTYIKLQIYCTNDWWITITLFTNGWYKKYIYDDLNTEKEKVKRIKIWTCGIKIEVWKV